MAISGYHNRHLLLHLFIISLMVHYGFTNGVHLWQFVTACFASFWLILRPTNIYIPLLAVFTTLADYLSTYPELSNHAVIQLFICLGIVFLLIYEGVLKKKYYFSNDSKTTFFRSVVFLIYFFSGFHKLNWGFIDSDQSCVHSLNFYVIRFLGLDSETTPLILTRSLQLATFFLELIVPIGLLFRRTCKLSVLFLFGFHAYLFAAGFAHFASVSVFMLAGCLLNYTESQTARNIQPRLKVYTIISFFAAVISFTFCNVKGNYFDDSGNLSRSFFISCSIYFTAFIYASNLFLKVQNPLRLNFRSLLSLKIFLPVFIIFLWGMEPYYGLSNRANMSMYSNMITMAGRDNHLLISTRCTKLIPFEEDYLQVLDVSSNFISKIGSNYKYYYYPLITFRYNASVWLKNIKDPVSVRIFYRGKEFIIPNLATSDFSRSRWYDRYFYYRPTPVRGYGVCVW